MQQALIETNLAQQPHRLTLDSRSRLSITGVLEVESFDDTEILLTSTRGPMSIRGQGLHLQQLSIDGGQVLVDGSVDAIVYEDDLPLKEKIEAVAAKIYRADGVSFTAAAKKQLETIEKLGFGKLPVCMAKTQYSFSDDPTLLGAPRGFQITIKDVKVCSGAGFVVAKTGDIMTMPGLPKVPAAEKIDVDENGVITGLF